MQRFTVGVFVAAIFIAASLPADVILRGHDASDMDPAKLAASSERPTLTSAVHNTSGTKGVPPAFFYALPFVKVLDGVADGDLTLLAIRNESSTASTVAVDFFNPEGLESGGTLTNALLPNEVWTLNLRAAMTGLPTGLDGVIRGYAIISADSPFTTDYFQLDPANDFAAGSRPVKVNDDLCQQATARFLVGGGFTGGTTFFLLLDQPLGGDPDTDPASVTGDVFDENGNLIGTFGIFTENFTLEVDAADIIPVGANFGSITFSFENPFSGGYVLAEYKANNRFSVSVPGACLEVLAE